MTASDHHQTMRVTLLTSWPPIPGISSYSVHLARALADRVELRVLSFKAMYPNFLYPRGPVPTDESFPPDDDRITVERRLAWYNPIGWIWAGLTTPGDILHLQFWSLPIAPVLIVVAIMYRLRGKRCLLTVHNPVAHDRKWGFHFALGLLIRLSHRVIVHVPDPPDNFSERCLRATGFPPEIVPHGVLDLYEESAPAETTSPPLPAGARGILFFGAIRPYKGLDLLIDAFGRIADQFPDAWLVIAGRPWEPWERYQSMIDARPGRDRVVTRLDYIPTSEVGGYFHACELVVLPYRQFETQSGVGLSAVGFAKPMIVTQVGGLPLLQPDPRYVVSTDDAEQLAEAMARYLNSPEDRDSLIRAAQQVASAHSWKEIAARTVALYHSVLFEGRRST